MSETVVPLRARTDVGRLALSSVHAASTAAASLRGGAAITVDGMRVAVAYSSERWLRVGGERPTAFAPLSGFFPTADGWVRTHGNYPRHALALRTALALGDAAGRTEVGDALSALTSADASDRITRAGGLCVEVAAEDRAASRGPARPYVRPCARSGPPLRVGSRRGSAGGRPRTRPHARDRRSHRDAHARTAGR